ncbi:MAG: calcium:sodium antiporter [Planctomycetes bacterium]|nr:calcium:sodium antiporter [Planctomycetota bacterium]MDP6407943.1 sodium:calcium antiporter [Planctomycetota bacterium]
MDSVALDLMVLLGGLLLLGKGGDWLVDGSAELARRRGVRPVIVGLTIVAWGTSAPEVMISSLAAAEGRPALALGNVLGSNIANIGLVLGVCALALPTLLQRGLSAWEASWLVASVGCAWWALADGAVSRGEGAALLAAFALHNLNLWLLVRGAAGTAPGPALQSAPWTRVVAGSIAIAIGAKLAVTGGVGVAEHIGISDRVVGLTIIALGTSLPELAAGLSGVLKNHSELSLGNIVGSNVFNVLAVIGVAAVIAPLEPSAPEAVTSIDRALGTDFPVVMGFSLALIFLSQFAGASGGRWKGALLVASYLAYTWRVLV